MRVFQGTVNSSWRWQGGASITAEAVEKANLLDHSIPDFCLHQFIQKHA
jgi:hypothetical protein